MTPEQFFDKASYEGGLLEFFDMGCSENDIDDSDPELKESIKLASDSFEDFRECLEQVRELFWKNHKLEE